MKKFRTESFLESRDLSAHSRLLNAVRDITDGAGDAAMLGDIIEEFKVINIQDRIIRCQSAILSIHVSARKCA